MNNSLFGWQSGFIMQMTYMWRDLLSVEINVLSVNFATFKKIFEDFFFVCAMSLQDAELSTIFFLFKTFNLYELI